MSLGVEKKEQNKLLLLQKSNDEIINKLLGNCPELKTDLQELIEKYHKLFSENESLTNEIILIKKTLLESEAQFRDFFNNTLEGLFHIDTDENYLMVNKTYAHMCGYEPDEMLLPGFKISDTWALEQEKDLILDEAKKKDLRGLIIKYKRKDGSEGYQELFLRSKYDINDRLEGYIGIAKEISDRLKSLNAEIDARGRAEFLVDLMSHDINNINQGLLMLLEYILQDTNLSDKHREPIALSVEQVHYTTELIRSVKKLQAVLEEPIHLEPRDPYNDIIDAADAAQRAFSHKKLNLHIGFEEGEVSVYADDFLSDIFFNLFHNALKHNQNNEVKVDITANIIPDGLLEIHMMDYGPGIPDEEKKRIFQRRLGAKGSGIGLTIVNYLLDRYEGYIQVKDRVEGDQDCGSDFILILQMGGTK